MSLRIIAGPAGSGKTSYIVRSVVEHLLDGPQGRRDVIVLVPDQATFQMERRILEDPRVEGFMDVHVLSFRRLCLSVLEESGGLSLPFITPVGKSMAIQSVLWGRRKDLTVFAPLVNYPGFRATLGRTLSELSAYDLTPESMRGLGQGGAMPALGQKIHDTSLVLEEYKAFLAGRFMDPDDYLDLAAEKMARSSLVRGATVWVDGFSGFTPKEYKVLRAVLQAAEQVNIALCIDARELARPANQASLFHATRETHDKMAGMAWAAGARVEQMVLLEAPGAQARFLEAPGLAAAESWIRADGLKDESAATATATAAAAGTGLCAPGVRIVAATNPQAELEFVAREITRLVRDQGLRYRDITVEARDLAEYAEMLPLVFRDYGIPFFLDRKASLSHHPLAELIRSALDVVLTGWSFEPVFRYLKTDLVPIPRDDVDFLENYVLSHGIAGERWISAEPWNYVRNYLAGDAADDQVSAREAEEEEKKEAEARRADGARRQATGALARFYLALRRSTGSVAAQDVSRAVVDLLVDLDVPSTLARWQNAAEEAGDLTEAEAHSGLWDKVIEILSQAGEILKGQPHDLKSYALLIGAGLEDVRLGAIPPSLDQVLVGSLDRSRQPDCKATFLIGALLGVFPKRQSEDSIFTDAEREYLRGQGVDLEPSSSLRQFHEKYLVYIALTRPSERLYVSYPLGDQEGKALTPSHVVDLLKKALPGLTEELVSSDPPGVMPDDLDYVLPARVGGAVVRRLSLLRKGIQPGHAWRETYRWLVQPERLPSWRGVLTSLGYTNRVEPLDRTLVRSLYGQTLFTSVSRLETFGACPFRHFAQEGLRLRERDVYRLEPADAGVFLHAALKGYVEEVARSGKDWAGLSWDDAQGLVDRVVERLAPQVAGEIFMSSARYRYVSAALRRILRRAGGMLLSQMKRGSFRPLAEEVLFGFPGGPKPYAVDLPGKDTVLLRGQIDRIDVARSPDGRALLRVVDYKSSPRALDLFDVYNGLALQLLVYLAVVLQSWKDIARGAVPGEPAPAAALYFSVIDPLVSAAGPVAPDDAERMLAKRFRMAGLVTGELSIARLMDSDGQGYSDIIPVRFKSDETSLGLTRSTVSPEDLADLLHFVRDKVRDMSAAIYSGQAGIAPFRRGAARACQYCPYGPLCSFDALLSGNGYRVIRPVAQDALWSEIRAHSRSGGGGDGGAAGGVATDASRRGGERLG